MSLDNDVRRLAATRPFSLLPREALQLLAFSCERRNLKAGQRLFAEGEYADSAFFILSGEITLTARGIRHRAAVGALIGETALAAEVPRGADATAAADSTLLKIPRATFRRVLDEFPESASKVHASAAARVQELLTKLEDVRLRGFQS